MGFFATLEDALAGATHPQSAIASVIGMIQAQPGGFVGVVQKFESAGLGGVARSWLAPGANQNVSAAQVHTALGPAPVGQVAKSLGVPQNQAADVIAQFLPLVLDHLSPTGRAPNGSGFGELAGLLKSVEGR